jgi:hypothetical protein
MIKLPANRSNRTREKDRNGERTKCIEYQLIWIYSQGHLGLFPMTHTDHDSRESNLSLKWTKQKIYLPVSL